MLLPRAAGDLVDLLRDKKHRKQVPHRMADVGYEPVRNPTAEDGLWKLNGKRQAVYVPKGLSTSERIAAARALAGGGR
jgi:hypothetical protein